MDAFGLGPLPHGWECKIEPKTGRLYFICHLEKRTTWDDPRLNLIPPPPYHVAVTQPTAYFEDAGGSRWSSPVPSLRAFSLNRRGSSPRLGGSPRIAPSPTLPPKSSRNEQLILESDQRVSGAHSSSTSTTTTTVIQHHLHHPAPPSYHSSPVPSPRTLPRTKQSHPPVPSPRVHRSRDDNDGLYPSSPQPGPSSSSAYMASSTVSAPGGSNKLLSSQTAGETTNDKPLLERPQSARSYSSSSYYSGLGIPASLLSNCDFDTAFSIVTAIFPTATPSHIRHLFHKYHNRANVVMSALQVEKHPVVNDIAQQLRLSEITQKQDGDTDAATSICADSKSIGVSSPFKVNSYTTGSPARTGTPISLLKFSNNQSSVGSLGPRWGSPLLSMSPQLQMVKEEGKLTRSPKMKLKYMKGIFPAADETFLLEILNSSENNVQKATEKMLRKGFTRTPPPKPARQKWLEVKNLIEKRQRDMEQHRFMLSLDTSNNGLESPFPTPVMKPARPHLSAQEKQDMRKRLKSKFPNYPERFIEWALDAAMFEVSKTERLLQEVSPQTPDEFKPFVVAAQPTPGDIKHDNQQQPQQRRIRFADGLETTPEFESGMMSPVLRERNNIDKLNIFPTSTTGFQQDNMDTPDSGYFELDTKSRRKNFISTIFGMRYDKERTLVPPTSSSSNTNAKGSGMAKGPNPALIRTNYIQTLGPSSAMGPTGRAQGHKPSLAKGPVTPKLHDKKGSSLAKGPVWGKRAGNNEQMSVHHVAVEG